MGPLQHHRLEAASIRGRRGGEVQGQPLPQLRTRGRRLAHRGAVLLPRQLRGLHFGDHAVLDDDRRHSPRRGPHRREQRLPRRDFPRARPEVQRPLPHGEHALRAALQACVGARGGHLLADREALVQGDEKGDHQRHPAHRHGQAQRHGQGTGRSLPDELGRLRRAVAGCGSVGVGDSSAALPERPDAQRRRQQPHQAVGSLQKAGLPLPRGVLRAGRPGACGGYPHTDAERPRQGQPAQLAGGLHRVCDYAVGRSDCQPIPPARCHRAAPRPERPELGPDLAGGIQSIARCGWQGQRPCSAGFGTLLGRDA
mmetsp:Transcript_125668/g.391308  ORF Transcript_125668/g.391308 Transcript_125668/m.391308 type:complete len:312 (-) Transcript_125668:186-1121(-)